MPLAEHCMSDPTGAASRWGSGGGLVLEVKAGVLHLQNNMVEFPQSHKRIRDAWSP